MRQSAEVQFMKLLRDCQRNPGNRVSFMRDAANDPGLLPETRRMAKAFLVIGTEDGGPGSGNWGHKGRPGQVGGSGKGGGAQYRGGRSDIAYVSSRQDWLNGLKGERQNEVQKFMKQMREHYGSDQGKSVEQMIMEEPQAKNGGNNTRQKLLDFMAESRGWDKYASRLVDENLDENEKKLAETLGNKYGLAFVGGAALPDDKDTSAWDADDLRAWQDLKSKAMGGPTSGQEPPDELMYEAGLKERPKPKGPDYSFADQPRQTYNQKHIEDQLQLACGVTKPAGVNLNAAQGFGDLNQQFVDHIANDPLMKNEVRDHGIRAIWGIRSLVEDAHGTEEFEKIIHERIDNLSDDEKAKLLDCANEFLPYYKMVKYRDVGQFTLNDFSGIEQNMVYSRDTKANRETIKNYLLLQEKLLTGAVPCSPEQHEINKVEAKRKEEEKREAEKAEWKKTATPEWVESHYHPQKVAGMTRRSSGDMSFEEADTSAANPRFGLGESLKSFRINCQTCVYAFEMRMRGYEVEAHGRNETTGIELRQMELAKDTTAGWIDPETGKAPELIRPQKRLANATRAKDWIESVVQPGQRYTLEFCYRDKGAHIITAGREANGDLFLYDPQNGKKRKGQEIVDYLGDNKNLNSTSGRKWLPGIMRVDHLLPKQEYYDTVLKKSMFVQ